MVRRHWRWLIVGDLLAFGFVYWLKIDDPEVRYETDIAKVVPVQEGDAESYEVFMRPAVELGKNEDWNIPAMPESWTGNYDEPEWIEQMRAADREPYKRAWESIAVPLAWLNEMNAFERLGDTSLTTYTYPGSDFSMMLIGLKNHITARAHLQMWDGDHDAAIVTLLPLYEVGAKMSEVSRSELRFLLGVMMAQDALQGFTRILVRGEVSKSVRLRLEAALRRHERAPLRPFFTATAEWLSSVEAAEIPDPLGSDLKLWLARIYRDLALNPRRTINRCGEIHAKMLKLAEAREIEALKSFEEEVRKEFHGWALKNRAGRAFMQFLAGSFFATTVEEVWENEDLRLALLDQLN